MKLDDISADMLRRAVTLYVALAYKQAPLPLVVKNRIAVCEENAGQGLAAVLSHRVVERVASPDEPGVVVSYAVRLGNEKYPHMKLALRRRAPDDYCFLVDAHDGHFEVKTTDPDAPRADELRTYNRRLKEEIESRWREADLPTLDET